MSRLKVENLRHPNASTDAFTLDSAGNVTVNGGLVAASPLSNRNGIINGAMNVAQRGTSFTASANNDDVYTLDRWNLVSDGNDAVDVTQATDAPTGFANSIGLDVETANKKFGIAQFIEAKNAKQFDGKQVTLSFYAKTTGSSIGDVKAVVLSWSSTADTVTSDVVSAWNASGTVPTWAANWTAENTPTNLNVTNSWARYSVTATVDTASMANVAVFIWCDDAATTAGDFLYVTGVQLEVGPVATPFEFEDFGTTLAKCQRYYYHIIAGTPYGYISGLGSAGAAGGIDVSVPLPVTMRAAPTGLTYANVAFSDFANAPISPSALILSTSTNNRNIVGLVATVSGATQYRPYALLGNNNAGGYVGLSAEL